MQNGFWAEGEGRLRKALRKKFNKQRKQLKTRLDQATSPAEKSELQSELEQLDKDQAQEWENIDDAIF